MKKTVALLSCCFVLLTTAQAQYSELVFPFTTYFDATNTLSFQPQNNADIGALHDVGVLELGSDNGWVEFPSTVSSFLREANDHFTISTFLYVPTTTDISANGNFIWCFHKSSTEGYLFLNAKDLRYAITTTSWQNENSVNSATPLPKGLWVNVMYVQDGLSGTVYLDNVKMAQAQVEILPNQLDLPNAWLGRSPYNGDAYLKDARYADFRLYKRALSDTERAEMAAKSNLLNRLEDGVTDDYDAAWYESRNTTVPKVAYQKITLPTEGKYGTQITWTTSDAAHLAADGTVVRQETDRDVDVTLTGTFTLNNETLTNQFNVKVKQKEPYKHYLFAFFPSNDDENIYFAVGDDGYNYTTINNDQAVLRAQGNSVMGGFRDPHILRGEDGKFYMVATDMRCALGWASNRGMVLMKSSDLINWTCSTVHFPTKYAGTYLEHVTRVWAPETIYDKVAGKYMIYFSILTDDGTVSYDKVFYAYANADFTDLEGEPVYFYDRGGASIDMDIVYNEADELYHAVFASPDNPGIGRTSAETLLPAAGASAGSQWSPFVAPIQQTNEGVEGAGVFRLINSDQWILMYDCYMNGHYQFCSSPDLENFTFVCNTATGGSFTPRHGTVLPITEEEYQALLTAFPSEEITGEITPDEDGNLNLTSDRIPRLCESTDGWDTVGNFWLMSSNANYVNGDARVNGAFIERWANNASIGATSAIKTLRYLPNGTYKLRASCIATRQTQQNLTVSGVTFAADDQSVTVHTKDGKPELYTLNFNIASSNDYTTSFSLSTLSNTDANWVAIDNIRLYYVGTEAEYHAALRQMHDDYIARAEALYEDLCVEFLPALQAAVAAVDPDATDYATIEHQLDALVAAMEVAEQNIETTMRLKETDIVPPGYLEHAHVKLCRSLCTDQWQTLVLPFSMTAEQIATSFGAGTLVKELSEATGTKDISLTFSTVEGITQNVPVIIKPGEAKEFYCIHDVNACPSSLPVTELPQISFIGNYSSQTVLTTADYYLKENAFYHSPGGTHVKPYRGFFRVTDESSVKSLILSFDDISTGIIGTAEEDSNDSDVYDLTGRRVDAARVKHGVYLKEGRKVIVR